MKAKSKFKKALLATDSGFMSQPTTQTVEEKPWERKPDFDKIDKTIKRQRLDDITNALNQTGYFHKMGWPWLCLEFGGIKYPMYISRYYPDLKLALDFEKDDNTDLKEELCQANGIHFFVINNFNEIEDIKKKLGEVN